MAPLSASESLPTELLDSIIGHLDNKQSSLNCLIQCSKSFHSRLQPVLYGTKTARERAMIRACKTGNNHTIRIAVSYGANVSYNNGFTKYQGPIDLTSWTLELAAQRGHVETVNLLLELGATFPSFKSVYIPGPRFTRYLCAPVKEDILLSLLRAGTQVAKHLDLSLTSVIRSGGSSELVRALVDHGLDVDRQERAYGYGMHHIIMTPLTAAILENKTSIFEFLIERGADIHGTEIHNPRRSEAAYPCRKPLHLPTFAAAKAMATHGTAMIQHYLDLSTDINLQTHARAYPFTTPIYTTPILTYLSSIEPWDTDPENQSPLLNPIDGLTFFLNHGATLEVPRTSTYNKRSSNRAIQVLSPIELLFNRCTLSHLTNHLFFPTISFLIIHGAGKNHAHEILTKYTSYTYSSPARDPLVSEQWSKFLALFISHHITHYPNQFTHLTRTSILHHLLLRSRPYEPLSQLDRLTITALTQSGSSLNDPFPPSSSEFESGFEGGGEGAVPSILHQICNYRNMGRFLHVCPHTDIWSCSRVQNLLSFFSFLFANGADALGKGGKGKGRNAIAILLEPTQSGYRLNKDGLEVLIKLGNLLLGEEGEKYGLEELRAVGGMGGGRGRIEGGRVGEMMVARGGGEGCVGKG